MDLNIIIRPKSTTKPNEIKNMGTVQVNRWFGNQLRPEGAWTLWWKRNYIHTRINQNYSSAILKINPNHISRILHFGFTIEILKNNLPIYLGEWDHNASFSSGFTIRINLESIQQKERSRNHETNAITVLPRQTKIEPIKEDVARHD